MNELDSVKLNKDFQNISKGTEGAIVHKYNENVFEWCFDGLPKKSSIAVTSNGCYSSKYAMEIFIKGIESLYEHTKFSNLIVCGRPVKELDVEFKNVHYYPNFNERLRRRLENGK